MAGLAARCYGRPPRCYRDVLPARLTAALVRDLFRAANGDRWGLSVEDFAAALDASVTQAFPDSEPSPAEVRTYAERLHLADVALAQACLLGRDAAWDHFILTHRPVLYRAADALDPSGAARELADALYGDLYGAKQGGGRPLFGYFHGRSTLATWLRAVLSQRFVDSMRARARTEALPDEDRHAPANPPPAIDPDRARLVPLLDQALRSAIAGLATKDRLRLRSYHVAGLTLAQIGRITGEHEATVSRNLTRTRKAVRDAAEQWLRDQAGLDRAQIVRALELAAEDTGELDLQQVFDPLAERKKSP